MLRFKTKFFSIILITISLLGVGFWKILPNPLFRAPVSTVIEDRNGNLLSTRIANDGQWRFPYNPNIPEKFKSAIIQFEDKRFYYHPGIDPFALARAVVQNFKTGRIVSGGSTITMQVIRLSRRGNSRTIWEKIVESVLAVRLECSHSKDEILTARMRF